MPTIPRTQQYYPSVPISELSDLYSKGDNRLNNQRACIISFLPKALRIDSSLPFNNKYILFIENTSNVTSISWSNKLYLNGESIDGEFFLLENSPTNKAEYEILFGNEVIDNFGIPLVDKLIITCVVRNGGSSITLSVEHTFVKSLNAINLPSSDEIRGMSVPFSGNPDSTNYILNHIKDYLPNGAILWNNNIIEIDEIESDSLLKIVTAIIYHNILVSSNNTPKFDFFFG
jgi:hypothetical protein